MVCRTLGTDSTKATQLLFLLECKFNWNPWSQVGPSPMHSSSSTCNSACFYGMLTSHLTGALEPVADSFYGMSSCLGCSPSSFWFSKLQVSHCLPVPKSTHWEAVLTSSGKVICSDLCPIHFYKHLHMPSIRTG
jgi:hypothetical protein